MPDAATGKISKRDGTDPAIPSLATFLVDNRERLVDRAIDVAKQYGYARYTTTIRAAWIEAVDSLTASLSDYLCGVSGSKSGLEAEADYSRDPRFAGMRKVARRHRSMGVTLQLYLGLFKHFRDIYLQMAEEYCVRHYPASDPCANNSCARDYPPGEAGRKSARARLFGFFDAAELSICADWAEATEDDRLKELQARARSFALEKDRYFSVFESLRDPAFLLDRERRLLNANQAAAEVFVGEASAGDIVYLRSMRTRRTSLEQVLKTASAGRDARDRSIWLETQKGLRCFDIRERAIHDAVENTQLGYIAILHDVTPHRRATEDAERAQRAMSSFLATMSHEIRTPLHGVLGATELLRDAETDRHGVYVDAIESAGRHLLQTLNKVLDYSRLEARPPTPTPKEWPLKEVFEEYGRFASVWARKSDVPFTLSIAGNLPARAVLDWEMTQQVLTNLVSNAIRHDGGDGVRVHIRRRARPDGPALRIEVCDTGPGIPPEQADTLFEPFGALVPGAASTGGAGLGLAISKRLVEAMGGEIGVRIRTGRTRFWFDFPYRSAPAGTSEIARAGEAGVMDVRLKSGLRCLVVDDDPIGMMITADQLRREGIEVTGAGSVAEAVSLAGSGHFDAFVIDYFLGDGDGASLAATLRRTRKADDSARYIALTANADMIYSAGDVGYPFDAALCKPVTGAQLVAAFDGCRPRASDPDSLAAPGRSSALTGVSPRIADAMATAFVAQWDDEVAKFLSGLAGGARDEVANLAHRLASSCAVMGITDLADGLRDLERECRNGGKAPDFEIWRMRIDPQLRAAPDRARSLAEAVR